MKPLLQMMPQVEFSHLALPFAGTLQLVAQSPQWVGSFVVSMQALPHFSNPLSQLTPHVLDAHVALPCSGSEHTVSQPPQ